MPEITAAYDWHGRTMLDSGGEKIGTIDQVYPDRANGPPEWARVDSSSPSAPPVRGASTCRWT
jgi:hypothetical protein